MLRANKRASGAALLTTVLIVALIASITTAIIADQHIHIRRTTNIIEAGKAYEYARAVEIWATRLLARDLREGGEERVDHQGENWALPLPSTEVEGGFLTGRILDLQGRFNLNNLLNNNQDEAQQSILQGDKIRFQLLLNKCGLAPELVSAIGDWIDPDTNRTFPGGAEDYAYLGLDPPYRTANMPLVSTSELSWIQGFDYDSYLCLSPFVSALPVRTTVNVNTAPVAVLMALVPNVSEIQAEQLVARREIEPYISLEEFHQAAAEVGISLTGTAGQGLDGNAIGVSSRYFLVIADTRIGRVRMRLFSKLERQDDGRVRVLMRGREVLQNL